jgi:hypothetical protein
MKKKLLRGSLITIFLVGMALAGWQIGPGVGGQDDEGHRQPEHQCSHAPQGKQVRCRCRRQCSATGAVEEDVKCRSWCFPKFCLCPIPHCP